ncbi:group 1 truncated hemoglobin [bacterium]|nr:group 1 truncated hemoglobin [bacterium]
MRARAAVAGWLFAASAALAVAQDGPLDRSEQDRRTARIVHESATLGSELYNKGNVEGCYRLFQGTLLAVQPMLDHRPKLALSVKQALDKAAAMRDPANGAFELRKALDAIQLETSASFPIPKKDKEAEKEKTTVVPKETDKEKVKTTEAALWDRLGGEKVVRPMVKDFVIAAAADPKVNITRNGKYKLDEKGVAKLEQSLLEYISATTGGPLKYSGKDMTTVHAGMKITDDEFNAMLRNIHDVMKKHNVANLERLDLLELVGDTRKQIVGK